MRILCLLSWKPTSRWLWDYLPEKDDQIEFAFINPPKDRFPGYGKLWGYYPSYWRLGLQVFPYQHQYDAIVTWEANTGLPLAFLRSLSRRRKSAHPPLIILNFVLKGKPVYDFLPFVRFAMRSVNQITCLSRREIQYYTQQLNYPIERCLKLQGPFRDFFSEAEDNPGDIHPGEYIFSAGRSQRDYQTLIEAVRDLPVNVIINARDFNLRGVKTATNVTINPFLPFEEYLQLLQAARFVVIPLQRSKHASGETFMIQAMTATKAVIASQTFSTAEMLDHGINGLLVPPGNPTALRQAIQDLIDHPELAERLGKTARQHYQERWSFPVVARQIDQVLAGVVRDGHFSGTLTNTK